MDFPYGDRIDKMTNGSYRKHGLGPNTAYVVSVTNIVHISENATSTENVEYMVKDDEKPEWQWDDGRHGWRDWRVAPGPAAAGAAATKNDPTEPKPKSKRRRLSSPRTSGSGESRPGRSFH